MKCELSQNICDNFAKIIPLAGLILVQYIYTACKIINIQFAFCTSTFMCDSNLILLGCVDTQISVDTQIIFESLQYAILIWI